MDEEQEAINELKAMSREELDNVAYDLKKWVCQCKGCINGTKVRDYGISPQYFWPCKKGGWINLNTNFFICGKHNHWIKKLVRKGYKEHDVFLKIVDYSIMPERKMIKLEFKPQNKLG